MLKINVHTNANKVAKYLEQKATAIEDADKAELAVISQAVQALAAKWAEDKNYYLVINSRPDVTGQKGRGTLSIQVMINNTDVAL